MTDKKIILHLCSSEYGSDTRDYSAHPDEYEVIHIGKEIGVENYHPPENVYGIIANPPCTMFSIARTVRAKKPRDLREGMKTVYECLRIIWEAQYHLEGTSLTPTLKFWALENPSTGSLRHFLGKPAMIYSPEEFGDNYSKKTALWGKFNEPPRLPLLKREVEKNKNVKYTHTPMTERDKTKLSDLRSIASPYFTKAFFEANR